MTAYKLSCRASLQQTPPKVTKKIKQITKSSPPLKTPQGIWARNNAEKAQAFTKHLEQVFQPHPLENTPEEQEDVTQLLETTYQLEPPIKRLKRTEVQEIINSLNPKKSPEYDFITSKILPTIGIQYLTQLFNAVLLKGYFSAQWKVTQIILIPKPGKPPRANILSSNKPPTHYIQSPRKASLKKTPPNGGKKSIINTESSIWLQKKAFHDRTNT
jgi:hypothetical protein